MATTRDIEITINQVTLLEKRFTNVEASVHYKAFGRHESDIEMEGVYVDILGQELDIMSFITHAEKCSIMESLIHKLMETGEVFTEEEIALYHKEVSQLPLENYAA